MTKLNLVLTPQENRQVRKTLEKWRSIARKATSLDTLVNKWALFVRSVQRGYSDSIYEYTNDLSVRDIIEDILTSVGESVRSKILEAVSPSDEIFLIATRATDKPLTRGAGRSHAWWFRIPLVLEGELLQDMQAEGLV